MRRQKASTYETGVHTEMCLQRRRSAGQLIRVHRARASAHMHMHTHMHMHMYTCVCVCVCVSLSLSLSLCVCVHAHLAPAAHPLADRE